MFKNFMCRVGTIVSAMIEGAAMHRHFGRVKTSTDVAARIKSWGAKHTTKKHNCCCT